MIIPNKLEIGDTIGVCAPSGPIVGDSIEELNTAIQMMQKRGFQVKLSKHIYGNQLEYAHTAKEKAEDIHELFLAKEVKMIWFAKGGNNSNCVFDALDYELIKRNPKIICGYSDATSLTNVIASKTGLVTFSGTNFKTIATDETIYSLEEVMKRFVDGSLEIGKPEEEYITLKPGEAEGELIGGNLSLFTNLITGKYQVDVQDKILFLEDLGFESEPASVSHNIYHLKQNGVFDKIKGLWIGHYEHESKISIEKIVMDCIGGVYSFPIIKSNNFGHTETKTVIPIGTKAKINTRKKGKIELTEKCVK